MWSHYFYNIKTKFIDHLMHICLFSRESPRHFFLLSLLFKRNNSNSGLERKGTVMQNEKALINDRLRVLKVSGKFSIPTIIYP